MEDMSFYMQGRFFYLDNSAPLFLVKSHFNISTLTVSRATTQLDISSKNKKRKIGKRKTAQLGGLFLIYMVFRVSFFHPRYRLSTLSIRVVDRLLPMILHPFSSILSASQ